MRLIDGDMLGLSGIEIFMCNGDYKEALKMLIDKIERAPVIEERKKGKWEHGAICSVCGERCDYYLSGTIWIDELPNFCPNCGTEMFPGGEEC